MISIKIKTDNAAFFYSGGQEVARILRKLADNFDIRDLPQTMEINSIMDVNGNVVGEIKSKR